MGKGEEMATAIMLIGALAVGMSAGWHGFKSPWLYIGTMGLWLVLLGSALKA